MGKGAPVFLAAAEQEIVRPDRGFRLTRRGGCSPVIVEADAPGEGEGLILAGKTHRPPQSARELREMRSDESPERLVAYLEAAKESCR